MIRTVSAQSPEECEYLDLILTTDRCLHPTFGLGNERGNRRLPKAIIWGLELLQAPSAIIQNSFSSMKAGQDGSVCFSVLVLKSTGGKR